MRHASAVLGAVLIGVIATGCDFPRAPAPPRLTARDSAGVQIVDNVSMVVAAAPWTVGAPTLSLGSLEGDPHLTLARVVGAIRLDDGRLVVADGDSNELRFFDSSGRFLSRTGGKGEGPGEFTHIRGLDRCGPTGFVAFDLNWEESLYSEDGTYRGKREPHVPQGMSPYNLSCDRQARTAVLGWGAVSSPRTGFFTTRDHLFLVDSAGAVSTDFGEWLVSERLGTPNGSGPHPFGRATVFALQNDQLYVGTGEQFEIRVFGLDGSLRRIIRGPHVSLEMTDSLRKAYLNTLLARTSAVGQASVRSRVSRMAWPAGIPAYTALRVDPLGSVWLKRFAVGVSEPERWAIIDPRLGYTGDVTLAPGQTLLRTEEAELLVLSRDELGVERILALPLTRGS